MALFSPVSEIYVSISNDSEVEAGSVSGGGVLMGDIAGVKACMGVLIGIIHGHGSAESISID